MFIDLGTRGSRIGLFPSTIANFQRPHQGIEGLESRRDRTSSGASPDVLRTLQARVAANGGWTWAPAGGAQSPVLPDRAGGGQPFSLHAEGDRVILTGAAGSWARGGSGALPGAPPPPTGRGGGATAAQSARRVWRPQSGGLPGAARPRNVAAGRGAAAGAAERVSARGRRPAMRTSPTHTGRVVGTRPEVQSAPAVQPPRATPPRRPARRPAGWQRPSWRCWPVCRLRPWRAGPGLVLGPLLPARRCALPAGLVSACESRRAAGSRGQWVSRNCAARCEPLAPGVRPSASA